MMKFRINRYIKHKKIFVKFKPDQIEKIDVNIQDHDLDNMIIYNLGISIFEMDDHQDIYPPPTREKEKAEAIKEGMICERCLELEDYYVTEKGKVTCKHNMSELLEEFKEIMKNYFE